MGILLAIRQYGGTKFPSSGEKSDGAIRTRGDSEQALSTSMTTTTAIYIKIDLSDFMPNSPVFLFLQFKKFTEVLAFIIILLRLLLKRGIQNMYPDTVHP